MSSAKRPGLITATCVVAWIGAAAGLVFLPTEYQHITARWGAWYGPVYVGSLFLSIVSFVGYWRMKRWGVYLCVALALLSLIHGVYQDVPISALLLGLAFQVAFVAPGLAYLHRMS